jgi:hypothetical protein
LSFPFDARRGLVIVRAELFGPTGSIVLRLALDTGATGTMVNIGPLATVGYDPSLTPERVQVTTGSGVEFVPLITISELKATAHGPNEEPVPLVAPHPTVEDSQAA